MPNYNKESGKPLHWPLWLVSLYCVLCKPSLLMSLFSLLWWNPLVNPVQDTLKLLSKFHIVTYRHILLWRAKASGIWHRIVGQVAALWIGRSRDRFPVVSLGIFSVVPPTEPCALRSTQPLKVSTRDFSWGKGSRCIWLMTYHPCSAETSRNPGP